MNEWSQSVKIAVDIFVAMVIVTALLTCAYISRGIMNYIDNERAATLSVQEYRVARMYEGAECYAQDIVSLVLENQGFPAVAVTRRDSTVISWDSVKGLCASAYTASAISLCLNSETTYACIVVYDKNGSLAEYHFTELEPLTYNSAEAGADDITELLLSEQGNAPIYVTTIGGAVISWGSDAGDPTDYTREEIEEMLNPDSIYDCTVTYDEDGNITGYRFTEKAVPKTDGYTVQEITTLVLESRGDPAVYVTNADHRQYAWDAEVGVHATAYTESGVPTVLTAGATYTRAISRRTDGSVRFYLFTEKVGG